MEKNESLNQKLSDEQHSDFDNLAKEVPFAGEEKETEKKVDPAFNLVDVRRDFYRGAEIFPGREADSVCRKAEPMNLVAEDEKIFSYEDVMSWPARPYNPNSRLNPSEFPKLREQKECDVKGNVVYRNIDYIASEYIGWTANMIQEIDDADLVVYLDKSGRPVSWLVNEFWEEFTDKSRPAEAFLAIDRYEWFKKIDRPLTPEYSLVEEPDGSRHKAHFSDFKSSVNKLPRDTFAKIRALFIPGGVESEDVDEIMNTPTGLESKKIVIVDEVENSGSTSDIAHWLLRQAIPEADIEDPEDRNHKRIFFVHLPRYHKDGTDDGELQMNETPVWYDPKKYKDESGRGVLDLNEGYFLNEYEKNPNNFTRAQKMGGIVLGEPLDIDKEPRRRSLMLQKDIRRLHQKFRLGQAR